MFGTYLVEKGLLTPDELLMALERQSSMRMSIGRLSYQRGFLDMNQVIAVLRAQPDEGLLFGELAVKMGFLTEGGIDCC